MADIARRSHSRVHCDRPVEVFHGAATGAKLADGRLLNMSLSGAYLSLAAELKRTTPYRLRVDAGDGPLEMPFRVVREGARGKDGRRGYGVVFNLTAEPERRLRRLLDQLRRRPPDAGEDRRERTLRDYWTL
ncbi:MAG: PilZ domain-containing protein [Elusimicrobia bacterium]|nr:PilZ domain-containing protein [Elusimicrobiota bacterium]